jgi:hypothetical protein
MLGCVYDSEIFSKEQRETIAVALNSREKNLSVNLCRIDRLCQPAASIMLCYGHWHQDPNRRQNRLA